MRPSSLARARNANPAQLRHTGVRESTHLRTAQHRAVVVVMHTAHQAGKRARAARNKITLHTSCRLQPRNCRNTALQHVHQ